MIAELLSGVLICRFCGGQAIRYRADLVQRERDVFKLFVRCDRCETDLVLVLVARGGALHLEWEVSP